jgi:hypothetical protein
MHGARGKSGLLDNMLPEKKAGCLCRGCELNKKFRFEGQYFCRYERAAGDLQILTLFTPVLNFLRLQDITACILKTP